MSINNEDLQAKKIKEKLLVFKSALKIIESKKNKGINVFNALGMNTQEIKHSAFLAWLLNPKMPHGLDSLFLKYFLNSVADYKVVCENVKQNSEIIGKSLGNIKLMLDDKDISVITEKVVVNKESRIDIFIASPVAKMAVVIENKVFTSMHDNQLNRYEDELAKHSEYRNYDKVFVYLTPHGDLPHDDDWCVFDYGAVVKIAKEILCGLPNKKESLKLRILLEDYTELVETEILHKNKELSTLCKQIWREHKDAIELLSSYTDNVGEVIAYIKSYLTSDYPDLVICKESKLSFEYYTKAAKDCFERNGENFSEYLIKGRIEQQDGPVSGGFCLYKNTESEWTATQKKIMRVSAPTKKAGNKYFGLGSFVLLYENERGILFDEIKEKLDMRLSDFVDVIKKTDEKLSEL